MGRYRARDLLMVPGLLSLARVPLAAVFPWAVARPPWALVVLAAAAVSDLLDGWYARRHHQVTPTGAILDPITDKLFAASVVLSLLAEGRLDWVGVVLLSTRELGELPLVLWWTCSRARRRAQLETPMANLPGKLATALALATVTAILLDLRLSGTLLLATGVTGAVAATVYWRRALSSARTPTYRDAAARS